MTGPGFLDPRWQRLIGQIGQAALAGAPIGWRQLRVEYRAAGRHIEVDVQLTGPDGVPRPARPDPVVVQLLGTLRTAMYQPGRGTWLAAVLVFTPAGPPATEFVIDVEPRWRRVPPPVGFADELRFFPRDDRFVPEWLRARVTGTAQSADEYGMRQPRVYDGLAPDGRPLVNRPVLLAAERDRILDYLGNAPVVLAARSYDVDAFAPDREPAVPLNFRTDGVWVWPGSVVHYLREHNVPPDPDLVSHIRHRQFVVPEVDEPTRELAVAAIIGL
ncbi:ferredoxin [Actinophytocola xinjiangensis]|uniref:Ferredoxin n=1 Tax=Actinophytocola xinjiangensis TaxID=485602 RepID=A0A7Z0WM60_9PSEU|nr:ferredoxin [Actinophytocola xinjiangensis]OLF10135.1 ferredoxin [Actinophytocola xinjiangensis]